VQTRRIGSPDGAGRHAKVCGLTRAVSCPLSPPIRIVAMLHTGACAETKGVSSAMMEATMAYKIIFRKGRRVSASKLWPCDLETAIAHAKAQLPIQREQTGATSVSVSCERTGDVMFTVTEQPEPAEL
jgi:hypothetical protein